MRKQIIALLAVTGCLILYVTCCSVVTTAQQPASQATAANEVSGTYTFLREGEFVQLTVDDGKLSGYISRFGDSDSDKGQFIDQFFDKTSLVGDRLTFNTKTVHGVWYAFNGRVTSPPANSPTAKAIG